MQRQNLGTAADLAAKVSKKKGHGSKSRFRVQRIASTRARGRA